MHWLALLPQPTPGTHDNAEALLRATSWLALQFSPRVARLEESAVLEAEASLRLFGGPERLVERLHASAAEAGFALCVSPWAGTSLAALALLRAGSQAVERTVERTDERTVERTVDLTADFDALDALPLSALSVAAAQRPMLERLGCRRLGDVRSLPRAALARRFGPALLRGLDEAYGEAPEAHEWLLLPERFEARLELPFRVEQAQALHHHALVLLRQLCAWLAARHTGVHDLTLAWHYDAMRPRDSASSGALHLHTAEATRDFSHLARLLGEHLALAQLEAPAGELRLEAGQASALHERSDSLLADAESGRPREALPLLLERLSVRLGPERVRCAQLVEDHRLDAMQAWAPWAQTRARATPRRPPPGPQPSWLVNPPLRLETHNEQPLHHGPLVHIAGPHRVEGGWWDVAPSRPASGQQRDYHLYFGAVCGLVWLYRERLGDAEPGWFLHGIFG